MKRGISVNTLMPKLERRVIVDSPSSSERCSTDAEPFTHWMMYNIPADTTSLPENAGIPGSVYGTQNGNDFFEPNYNGPFGDFTPAGPEGLYRELIEASRDGHVLASASIAGHFASVAGD